ncbi:MAG: hypothetical protein Q8R76_02265, partial [Candidatus Omnitrophota bacterium]|nr:hypothetical protein [Candidatus Omnitrophota bacterium]
RHEAFVRLHEITRLCLLGFLALDDQILKQLSEDSGNSLQRAVSNLSAAKGQYLEGQEMWIG